MEWPCMNGIISSGFGGKGPCNHYIVTCMIVYNNENKLYTMHCNINFTSSDS
jgi:hypothetical protein